MKFLTRAARAAWSRATDTMTSDKKACADMWREYRMLYEDDARAVLAVVIAELRVRVAMQERVMDNHPHDSDVHILAHNKRKVLFELIKEFDV